MFYSPVTPHPTSFPAVDIVGMSRYLVDPINRLLSTRNMGYLPNRNTLSLSVMTHLECEWRSGNTVNRIGCKSMFTMATYEAGGASECMFSCSDGPHIGYS